MHRGRLLGLTAFASLIAACSLPPPADVPDDGDIVPDAAPDGTPPDTNTTRAELVAEASEHDFDAVVVGQQSAPFSFVIRNAGDAPSSALDVAVDGDEFSLDPIGDGSDCVGSTLEVDQTCLVRVRFAPSEAGNREATLRVSATEGGTASASLRGVGLTPGNLVITVGDTLVFGTVAIQSATAAQTITVRNSGEAATASLTVNVGDPTNYTKVADDCAGAPLAPGATCDVQVRFNPTSVGSLPTQVSIRESENVGVSASAAGTGSATITVTGGAGGTITSNPAGINCGSSCSAAFTQSPVTLTASVPNGYAFDGWTGACASEGTNATCVLPLTTAATNAGATFRPWSCTPNTIVCDEASEHYVDCTADGHIAFEMDCPLGCASGMEKCLDVKPSNDTAMGELSAYLDMAKDGPVVAFTGSSAIDVSTGSASSGGTGITIPTAMVDGMRVFWMKSLSIDGTLSVTGSNGAPPPVFLVDEDVVIAGVLDVSSKDHLTPGPGAAKSTACRGGNATYSPGAPSAGAGGAGNFTNGAAGGAAAGVAGGAGGTGQIQSLVPLRGGCDGGGTGNLFDTLGWPGRAGGAVEIVSRTSITVTGQIDASGGGGKAGKPSQSGGTVYTGGGGGGSGGGVLLEAPQVLVSGANAVISTKGGGGGAMGSTASGGDGQDGGVGPGAPLGGGQGGTVPKGGNGGTATGGTPTSPTAGQAGTGTNHGGGGGGSVGQLRINTRSGIFSPQNGAAIRSALHDGTVASRPVP